MMTVEFFKGFGFGIFRKNKNTHIILGFVGITFWDK
jgi:hypothetical protein